MNFSGLMCDSCNKAFIADDEVVVCPDCGAPAHRDCYDSLGKCFFNEQHSDSDFSYDNLLKERIKNGELDWKICNSCNTVAPPDEKICQRCYKNIDAPVSSNDRMPGGIPFPGGNSEENPRKGGFFADLPGVSSMRLPTVDPIDEKFSDEHIHDKADYRSESSTHVSDADSKEHITVGEMAKYVKTNILYFLEIFKNIKVYDKSRFNFSAFLFSGGYFLYRKMYFIGALLSFAFISLVALQTYFTNSAIYAEVFEELGRFGLGSEEFYNLDYTRAFYYVMPQICFMMRICIMVFCGLTSNRLYYKHCASKIYDLIDKAKLQNHQNEQNGIAGTPDDSLPHDFSSAVNKLHANLDYLLQTSGGVNTTLGIIGVLMFVYGILLS